ILSFGQTAYLSITPRAVHPADLVGPSVPPRPRSAGDREYDREGQQQVLFARLPLALAKLRLRSSLQQILTFCFSLLRSTRGVAYENNLLLASAYRHEDFKSS